MAANAEITNVELDVSAIEVGVSCGTELRDERGTVLISQGTPITTSLIDGLRRRGIERLHVTAQQARQLRGQPAPPPPPKAEKRAAPSQNPADWARGIPLKVNLIDCHHLPLDPARRRQIRQNVTAARDHFTTMQAELSAGRPGSAEAVSELTGAFASRICEDMDQAVGEVVSDLTMSCSTDRAVQLATLGMAVGTELDLDGPAVLQLGLAGLLHDVGQFQMDPWLWLPFRSPFDDQQMWEYRKHPILSRQTLQEMGDLPGVVVQVVEQVHEQIGGGGYPYGLTGSRIHPHARILGVCDTYLQLIRGTTFRRPLVPHDALGLILHLGGRGIFDPEAVRCLLRIESMYPIGSRVRLGDGRSGSVIRRPVDGYSRPVVMADDGERIDTAQANQPMTVEPSDDPLAPIRLTPAQMRALDWNPADDLIL